MLESICYRDKNNKTIPHQEPINHFHTTTELLHYAPKGAQTVKGIDAGVEFTMQIIGNSLKAVATIH